MPYAKTSDLPTYVRKYPAKQQKIWLRVFNSVYNKAKKDGKSQKEAEASASKAANSKLPKKKGVKSYLEVFTEVFERHQSIDGGSRASEIANIIAISTCLMNPDFEDIQAKEWVNDRIQKTGETVSAELQFAKSGKDIKDAAEKLIEKTQKKLKSEQMKKNPNEFKTSNYEYQLKKLKLIKRNIESDDSYFSLTVWDLQELGF